MLRNAFIFVIALALTFPAHAGEQTLITGEIESGGFGGPVLRIGGINGETGVWMGGRGGWIINHRFILGGGGCGLVSDVEAFKEAGETYYIEMGYGGMELEFIIKSDQMVHFSVMSLFGAGGITINRHGDVDQTANDDAVFVMEPAAALEINIVEFFRINIGASYRYVSGFKTVHGISESDLAGVSGVLTLKFGEF